MNSMLPTLDDLINIERGFYRALSQCQPVSWGEFCRNDHNPDSHDSNHAYLATPVNAEQFSQVLEEVVAFYRGSPAGSRLRYHSAILPTSLLDIAEKAGWKTRLESSSWRAWPASSPPATMDKIEGLTIRLATCSDIESCHRVREEDNAEESHTRSRRTWEQLTRSPYVSPLLADFDGEPAAVLAVVWHKRWGCVEAVDTRQRFRRRGICSALLRFAQDLAIDRQCNGLMLYDIDDGPDRVYARAGFQLVGKTECATAWRE